MVNWTAIHLAAAALGLVRQPAKVNRHGRKPPTWDELLHAAAPAPSAHAQVAAEIAAPPGPSADAGGEALARGVAFAQKIAAREVRLRARAAHAARASLATDARRRATAAE